MTDDDLRRALSELPDPRPRDDWQARVHRRTMTRELESPGRRARWAQVGAFAAAVALIVIGVVTWQQDERAATRERALMSEKQAAEEEAKRSAREAEELKLQIDQIELEREMLAERLASASTDAERVAIRRELDEKKARLDTLRNKGKSSAKPMLRDMGVKVSCDPNDPLCGVK